MNKLINGDRTLSLRKSKRLVGLKTNEKKFDNPLIVNRREVPLIGGFEIYEIDKSKASAQKDSLDSLRKEDSVELGTHVYFAADSVKPIIPTGKIVLHFHHLSNSEEQHIVLDEFKLKLVDRVGELLVIAQTTSKSKNPIKVAQSLNQLSIVDSAEADFDIPLNQYEFAVPTDNLLREQWQFNNTGFTSFSSNKIKKGADAKILQAWNYLGNMGSDKISIALIDSGFDTNHPDLRSKVRFPYDINTQSSRLISGDPNQTHGTSCASIALAKAHNHGIVGVAPNSTFIPVHSPKYGAFELKKMLQHCIQSRADIISCSWGTIDPNFALNGFKKDIINNASKQGRNGKGTIILFAAGNEGSNRINYYAQHPNVIAVGASDSRDQHSPYSNKGRGLSVCAPSDGAIPVIAARASWDQERPLNHGRLVNYKAFGGTSAATPLVAGICALMLSINPDLTASEVKEILESTADKIGNPWDYDASGYSVKYGYGRVNALKAVMEADRRKRRQSRREHTPVRNDSNTSSDSPRTTRPRKEESEIPNPPTDHQAIHQPLDKLKPSVLSQGDYYIQLGVFSSQKNAEKESKRIKAKHDIPLFIKDFNTGSRTLYRLLSIEFENKDKAKIYNAALKTKGINGFIRKKD